MHHGYKKSVRVKQKHLAFLKSPVNLKALTQNKLSSTKHIVAWLKKQDLLKYLLHHRLISNDMQLPLLTFGYNKFVSKPNMPICLLCLYPPFDMIMGLICMPSNMLEEVVGGDLNCPHLILGE